MMSLAYAICAALLVMIREGVRGDVSPTLPLLLRLKGFIVFRAISLILVVVSGRAVTR